MSREQLLCYEDLFWLHGLCVPGDVVDASSAISGLAGVFGFTGPLGGCLALCKLHMQCKSNLQDDMSDSYPVLADRRKEAMHCVTILRHCYSLFLFG